MNIRPSPRFDSLEREAFKAVIEGASFALIRQRMEQELHRAAETCITAEGELELRRAQGAVNALRAVLKIPLLIYQEMGATK